MVDMLIDPFTTGQVRSFHSIWRRASLEELGVRKTELMDDLNRAMTPYMGKRLTPELTVEIKETIKRVSGAFVKRHDDIRFTKADIEIQFGNFDLKLEIERSGIELATIKQLHPTLRAELGYKVENDHRVRRDGTILGERADVMIVDDPFRFNRVTSEAIAEFFKTPITTASGDQLDAIAFTNSAALTRKPGESDDDFRVRVGRVMNQETKPDRVQAILARSSGENKPSNRFPYRCNVPLCGESGVCEECRKRGAR